MSNNQAEFKTYYKVYNKKNKVLNSILTAISIVVCFFCITIVCLSVVFFRAQVIGASMQPTFNISLGENENPETSIYKDIVVVNRFQKGTNGDIVLIDKSAEDIEYSGGIISIKEETLIKRIIASQGQVLSIRYIDEYGYCQYYINGELLNEPYIKSQYDMNEKYFELFCQCNDNKENNFQIEYTNNYIEASITIGKNQVFVLGDNRGNSEDSHIFGPVNIDEIMGKVVYYYAYDESLIGALWQEFCSLF